MECCRPEHGRDLAIGFNPLPGEPGLRGSQHAIRQEMQERPGALRSLDNQAPTNGDKLRADGRYGSVTDNLHAHKAAADRTLAGAHVNRKPLHTRTFQIILSTNGQVAVACVHARRPFAQTIIAGLGIQEKRRIVNIADTVRQRPRAGITEIGPAVVVWRRTAGRLVAPDDRVDRCAAADGATAGIGNIPDNCATRQVAFVGSAAVVETSVAGDDTGIQTAAEGAAALIHRCVGGNKAGLQQTAGRAASSIIRIV